MKPIKQLVYLPVNGDYLTAVCHFEHTEWCHHETVQPQEVFVFTTEQLNEYTSNIIKQALEAAAERADITYTQEKTFDFTKVDKQSITNTFEETFKKFKV